MTTPEAVRGASSLRAAIAVWALLAVVAIPVAGGFSVPAGATIAGTGAWLYLARKHLMRWRTQLTFLLLVIYFIPIGRYTLQASLPFELEPYRIVVALVIVCWIGALLVDERVRLRMHIERGRRAAAGGEDCGDGAQRGGAASAQA